MKGINALGEGNEIWCECVVGLDQIDRKFIEDQNMKEEERNK